MTAGIVGALIALPFLFAGLVVLMAPVEWLYDADAIFAEAMKRLKMQGKIP